MYISDVNKNKQHHEYLRNITQNLHSLFHRVRSRSWTILLSACTHGGPGNPLCKFRPAIRVCSLFCIRNHRQSSFTLVIPDIMYKVTGCKSLRDKISEALASPGMELRSFDILEDDFTRLYIIQADYWGGGRYDFESQGFWAEMKEVLPDAECICSRAIASAYLIIFEEEL